MIYIAQEDSDSENLAVTDSGDNVNFIGTSGSTISGKSTAELDSSSSANTATLQFKLLRLAPIPVVDVAKEGKDIEEGGEGNEEED